jgi:uncharacterized protein (TIGR02246 family)
LSVPLVCLVAGCGDGGAPPTEPRAFPREASAAVGATQSQAGAVADLVAIATAAWTAKDAAAYASIYSEDAQVISPIGSYLLGREGVRQGHVFLFNGPFAGSTQTISIRSIQFLTGTIAIVDQDVALTGYAFLPPNGLRATEPGVVRTTVRWVVMKRGASWEIVAQQMTLIPPTA